jgi:hypothetical protein
MASGEHTADSYRMSAELLLTKHGDKSKIINFLFKASDLYIVEDPEKAIECLDEINKNLKGSTPEFEIDQYFDYLTLLAKSYEELMEEEKAADIFSELAKEIYRLKNRLKMEKKYSEIQVLTKFTAVLAKGLLLYDNLKKYDLILKLARKYYKVFPEIQQYEALHPKLFFCYEHIINAADRTGSRYFREYYSQLDDTLRGIPFEYEKAEDAERKGPYV